MTDHPMILPESSRAIILTDGDGGQFIVAVKYIVCVRTTDRFAEEGIRTEVELIERRHAYAKESIEEVAEKIAKAQQMLVPIDCNDRMVF